MLRRSIELAIIVCTFIVLALPLTARSTPSAPAVAGPAVRPADEPAMPPDARACTGADEAAAAIGAPVLALSTETIEGVCGPLKCEAREAICEELCTCPRGDGVRNFNCETVGNRCVVTCRCNGPTSCPI